MISTSYGALDFDDSVSSVEVCLVKVILVGDLGTIQYRLLCC